MATDLSIDSIKAWLVAHDSRYQELLENLEWPEDSSLGIPEDLLSDAIHLKNGLALLRTRVLHEQAYTTRHDRVNGALSAHGIVHLSAFFEAVTSVSGNRNKYGPPSSFETAAALRKLYGRVLSEEIPTPSTHGSLNDLFQAGTTYFGKLSRLVDNTLRGLARDREESADQIQKFALDLRYFVTGRSTENLKRWAPEIGAYYSEYLLWTGLITGTVVAAQEDRSIPEKIQESIDNLSRIVRTSTTGLVGLPELLTLSATSERTLAAPWDEIKKSYDADFSRPAVEASEIFAATEIDIPPLRDLYLNPRYKVCENHRRSRPFENSWWEALNEPEPDIQSYLASYLTSPNSLHFPLVVLGDPGAGKSALTRAISANLGKVDYRPIRVELRHLPSHLDVLDKVELSIKRAIHRRVHWSDLASGAGDHIIVLIFDGFDELLQNSRENHYYFLDQLRSFQEEEAAQGRSVATIVTSRTVVAHRMSIPVGSDMIRIEPFDDSQMEDWLERWRALVELPHPGYAPTRNSLGSYEDLARQPLLMLMIALFCATGKQLSSRHYGQEMKHHMQVDFYRELLVEFVERELRRRSPNESKSSLLPLIEEELDRLSYAALGMFNRTSQSIREEELDVDLAALPVISAGLPTSAGDASGLQDRSLSAAQLLIGRFFFIHESLSTIDEDEETLNSFTNASYEFLHSTFGEYLLARLVVRVLGVLTRQPTEPLSATPAGHRVSEQLLFTILSFEPLSTSRKILDFLREEQSRYPLNDVDRISQVLWTILAKALDFQPYASTNGYEPRKHSLPRRVACYSVNIATIALQLPPRVGKTPLFQGSGLSCERWRELTEVWRACLSPGSWESISEELIAVRWSVDDLQLLTSVDLAEQERLYSSGTDNSLPTYTSEEVPAMARELSPFLHFSKKLYLHRTWACSADEALLRVAMSVTEARRSKSTIGLGDLDYLVAIFVGYELDIEDRRLYAGLLEHLLRQEQRALTAPTVLTRAIRLLASSDPSV